MELLAATVVVPIIFYGALLIGRLVAEFINGLYDLTLGELEGTGSEKGDSHE